MGTSRNPAGSEIAADSLSLLRDGQRWLPVMGEFHFSRWVSSVHRWSSSVGIGSEPPGMTSL